MRTSVRDAAAGRLGSLRAAGILAVLGLALLNCSAFNPAAVRVLLPPDVADEVAGSNISNPSGHVPILFINNTRFSGAVLDYLRSRNVEVPADPDLRPRVRFRIEITFVSGAISRFEFVTGSDLIEGALSIVDEDGNTVIIPAIPPEDLLENELDNIVVVCDVGAVVPDEAITDMSTSVEVFVPTFIKEIRVVENNFGQIRRELTEQTSPRFFPLLVDTVDESGTIVVLRNFGTRQIPGFPTNLTCGSVVAFVLAGDLTLPFVVDENDQTVPGFLDTDDLSPPTIPGRYSLSVSVR